VRSPRGYWIAVPFAAAWILSVCPGSGSAPTVARKRICTAFSDFPFPPRVGYFTLCGLAFLTRNRFRFSGFLIPVLLSGALGSEFVLVWFRSMLLKVVPAVRRDRPLGRNGVRADRPGAIARCCDPNSWRRKDSLDETARGKTILILMAFLAGMGITAMV